VTDIVERLEHTRFGNVAADDLMRDAAVEIVWLRAALSFYAEEANWKPVWDAQFKVWVNPIDNGKRARAALSPSPVSTGENDA
jgi:hypothetical protein